MSDPGQHIHQPAPRGELFSDPGARVVWAAVKNLDEAVKHQLLDHLASELVVSENRTNPHEVRVATAVRALREAASMTGEQPGKVQLSQRRYCELYATHGRERGWPSDSLLRRWLGGSWNDALLRAALPAVPNGDAVVRETGPAFTREECLAAIRAYIEEEGDPVPGIHAVISWAKRPDIRRRRGHRPCSQGPYQRVFGSWHHALVAVGAISVDEGTGAAVGGAEGYGSVRPARAYGYTAEHIGEALREVADRLGASPKMSQYVHERDRILAEEREAGRLPRAFPSHSVIQQRYRTWDDALESAGLEPVRGRHNPTFAPEGITRPRRFSEQELLQAIRDAFHDVGAPFTTTAYAQWRKRQLTAARDERRWLRLPDYPTIWQRFGTWAQACEAALTARPDSERDDDETPGAGVAA